MMTPLNAGQSCRACQPFDIVKDGVFWRLDATVIGVDGLVGEDLGIHEVPGFLLVGEGFDVFAQAPLVAFESARM